MKKHAIPFLLAAICATLLSACASGRIRSIHTVMVDPKVARPKAMGYTNQASANVDMFASPTMGLLPALVLTGVHHGVISKPRKEMEAAVASRSIAIETIVPPAFSDELARSGLFTVVPSGAADATFNLKILQYGLNHMGDAWTSSLLAPTVMLEARLVGSDGKNIETLKVFGAPPAADWHVHEQYRDNPELLRAGWEQAARSAARVAITQLRKEMPH